MKAVFKEGAKRQCLEWLTEATENLQFQYSTIEKMTLINLIIDANRFEITVGPFTGSRFPYSMIIPKETLVKLKNHTGKFPLREEWIDIVKSKVEEDYVDKVKELL